MNIVSMVSYGQIYGDFLEIFHLLMWGSSYFTNGLQIKNWTVSTACSESILTAMLNDILADLN